MKKSIRVSPKRMAVLALREPESLYDKDFCAWSDRQSELLKRGDFSRLDIENLVEEIESLGKSQRHALLSHTINLLMHLLKKNFQPSKLTKSWEKSISNARLEMILLLDENPSLRRELPAYLKKAYPYARIKAEEETGLDIRRFPKECPWAIAEILNEERYFR